MSLEYKINSPEWRIISHGVGSAPRHIAIDHALLDLMDEKLSKGEEVKPILRTYSFDRGSIILGRQQYSKNFDRSLLNGYYLTTRMTGGGHLYISPKDINYSVLIPKEKLPKDLIESFKSINYGVKESLKELGYDVKLGRTSIKAEYGGEKALMGSAQRRTKNLILQHGSIIIDNYTSTIFDLLNATQAEIKAWHEQVVTLSMLPGNLDRKRILENIREKFAGTDYKESNLTQEELKLSVKHMKNIYTNQEVIDSGNKKHPICILEGLMTGDYQRHLEEHAGVENDQA